MPLTPSGEWFPAPIRTPHYLTEEDARLGILTRPWAMWYQQVYGAGKKSETVPVYPPGNFSNFRNGVFWIESPCLWMDMTVENNNLALSCNQNPRILAGQGVWGGLILRPRIFPDENGEIECWCRVEDLVLGTPVLGNFANIIGHYMSSTFFRAMGIGTQSNNASPRISGLYSANQDTTGVTRVVDANNRVGSVFDLKWYLSPGDPNVNTYNKLFYEIDIDGAGYAAIADFWPAAALETKHHPHEGLRLGIGYASNDLSINFSGKITQFNVTKGWLANTG